MVRRTSRAEPMVPKASQRDRNHLQVQAALSLRSCVHTVQRTGGRLLCRAREGTPRGQEPGHHQIAEYAHARDDQYDQLDAATTNASVNASARRIPWNTDTADTSCTRADVRSHSGQFFWSPSITSGAGARRECDRIPHRTPRHRRGRRRDARSFRLHY